MRRTLALIALATPLAACGVSKDVYLQKESELAACRSDLTSGEAALATCRQDLDAGERGAPENRASLESCLAEKANLQQAAAQSPATDAARRNTEQEAAACRDAKTQTDADLGQAKRDLETCRGDTEAAKREIETLRIREAELRDRLEKEIQEKTVEIENLKARLSVHVVDKILFDSGSAEILPAGKAILDKVASVVGSTSEQIRVEGHTDDVPVSKRLKRKFFSNWELSAARAASVVRYFEYGKGIDPRRMEAVGLGFHRPEVANDSFEGRAQNRRVVIALTAPAQALAAGAPPKP